MGKKKKKGNKPRPTQLALLENGVFRVPSPDGEGVSEYNYLAPTPEQITYFARQSRHPDSLKKLDSIYDLLEDILEEDDYEEIIYRMRKRDDALTMATLLPAVRDLIAGTSGFPTKSPSDSSSSEKSTGRRSTGRVQPEASTPAISTSSGTQPSSTSGSTNM